jgi:hypothetical protein
MTLVFFHVRTTHSSVFTPAPPVSVEEVTQKKVDDLASQLPFTPVTPTFYTDVMALKSAKIGTFADGTKYLDVYWDLKAPLTTLHMREVGVPLAERTQYDYVQSLQSPQQPRLIWMLPGQMQWQPMGDRAGSSGSLIVGADFSHGKFSVTLEIYMRGGNSSAQEATTLRLMSLSMYPGITYQPLSSVFPPSNGSVIHYQVSTRDVSYGKPYTWDVYVDSQHGHTRATLYDGLGHEVYVDYMISGGQWTRCSPSSTCVVLPALPLTEPVSLGNKAANFFDNINPDIQNGELWNLGLQIAPSSLGIGRGQVYALAFVSGPHPMMVYVSKDTMDVVGVISDVGSPIQPGGQDATSPLSVPGGESCSNVVAYPLIAYLPSDSAIPVLTAPEPSVAGKYPASIETC